MMQFPILASLLEGYDTCKASVKESVNVPNPTPATKKNKKMADAVFARYRNHIKTSGFNQSYAKKHRKEMNEGMHVVKSKDGIEKRFKDVNSVEAKSWKENTAKKMSVKLAVYSDSYWEKKESNSDDSNFLTPWEKIGQQGDDSDQIERLVKDQHSAGKIDWTLGKTG